MPFQDLLKLFSHYIRLYLILKGLERSNPLCELQIAVYMLEIERHGKEVGSVTSIPRFQRL